MEPDAGRVGVEGRRDREAEVVRVAQQHSDGAARRPGAREVGPAVAVEVPTDELGARRAELDRGRERRGAGVRGVRDLPAAGRADREVVVPVRVEVRGDDAVRVAGERVRDRGRRREACPRRRRAGSSMLSPVWDATATSTRASALRGATRTSCGLPPTGTGVPAANVPSPWLMSGVMVSVPMLMTTTSSRPSRSKSPAAMPLCCEGPAVVCGAWNVPSPLPSRAETFDPAEARRRHVDDPVGVEVAGRQGERRRGGEALPRGSKSTAAGAAGARTARTPTAAPIAATRRISRPRQPDVHRRAALERAVADLERPVVPLLGAALEVDLLHSRSPRPSKRTVGGNAVPG